MGASRDEVQVAVDTFAHHEARVRAAGGDMWDAVALRAEHVARTLLHPSADDTQCAVVRQHVAQFPLVVDPDDDYWVEDRVALVRDLVAAADLGRALLDALMDVPLDRAQVLDPALVAAHVSAALELTWAGDGRVLDVALSLEGDFPGSLRELLDTAAAVTGVPALV